MFGSKHAVAITPQGGQPVLTIRLRIQVKAPVGGTVQIADVLLQAGTIATGWVPQVTEMPWISGVKTG